MIPGYDIRPIVIKDNAVGKIINFNKSGKQITKRKETKLARENRVKFGQKKTTRTLIKKEIKAMEDHLDSHKISKKGTPDNKDKD